MNDAREQARHISEVTKAFAEGRSVEFSVNGGPWMKAAFPCWNFSDRDYRVKPEERKPREWEIHTNSHGLPFDYIGPDMPTNAKFKVVEVLPETETE